MFKPLKNNKGMTITSVVVAFGILITACVLFTKSMQISTNMIGMSDDEKDGLEDSIDKYYSERASEATSEATFDFKDDSDNLVFRLSAPVARTEPATYTSGKTKEYSYGFEFFSSSEVRGEATT